MQIREYDYILDIRKSNTYERVELVQNDTQTNIFNITLKDGEDIYNLEDTIVNIVFKKPDKTTVTQGTEDLELPITIEENVIKCTLKGNTINAPGSVLAEIKVSNIDGKLLTSQRFDFRVRKSLLTDKAVESTNEFPLLERLIKDVNALNNLLTQNEIDRNEELQIKLIEFETALNNFINAQGNIIDNKLDEVNSIMLDVNILIGEVNDKLTDVDNKLDDVDNIVDNLIDTIDNKIIDVNSVISAIEIAEGERRQAEFSRVSAEENRVTEFAGFEGRIEDTEDEIVALKEDLTTHKHPSLLGKYTYNGNKVVNVTNLDVTTGIFTSPNHGLTNGMRTAITLRKGVSLQDKNTMPSPLQNSWRRVVNATQDTFQLSPTANGEPVKYENNPNIDYSKWQLEAVQGVVTSIVLDDLRPSRKVLARYNCKGHLQSLNVFRVVPSFIGGSSYNYIDSEVGLSTTALAPNIHLYGHSQLCMWGEVEFNVGNDYITMALNLFRANLATGTNPLSDLTVKKYNRVFWCNDPTLVGKDITDMELNLGGHMMLNGSTLEVYSLDETGGIQYPNG